MSNEHLFKYLDGGHGRSRPTFFRGLIGQAITQNEYHLKDTIEFTPIKSPELPDIPDDVVSDISRDQNLLFNILV